MREAARVGAASAAAFALTLGLAGPAAAADGPYPACQSFGVTLEYGGDANQKLRTFTDKDGHEVAVVTGRADSVKVTNASTGQSVTVPSRGARIESVENSDGTTTVTWTGNLLLLLFDSDLGGAGLDPRSTTLVSGRVVFTIDESGVFTVLNVSGAQTDICAALAP